MRLAFVAWVVYAVLEERPRSVRVTGIVGGHRSLHDSQGSMAKLGNVGPRSLQGSSHVDYSIMFNRCVNIWFVRQYMVCARI